MTPELGNVVQGHLGNEITGLEQALIDLHDANSAGLDNAIEAATSDETSVDRTARATVHCYSTAGGIVSRARSRGESLQPTGPGEQTARQR